MTVIEHLALLFLHASIASLAAGLCIWAVLQLALRLSPALAAQRWTWLFPQLLIVATFLILLLPQSGKLSVLPAIDLSTRVALPAAMPVEAGSEGSDAGLDTESADDTVGIWLAHGAQAWLLIYLAGLSANLARLMGAQHALRGLRHGATPLADLESHPGFAALACKPGVTIFETEAPVSPMLVGLRKPYLLLPVQLRSFDTLQQQMVIAHELTHLSRRDHLWMAASLVTRTLLWFNPTLAQLGQRLTLAQELSCDQQVLQGRPQPQRRAYAAALLAQLKLQQHAFGAAMAFGGNSAKPFFLRILQIRQDGAMSTSALTRCVVVTMVAALSLGSVFMQPVFALQTENRVPSGPATAMQWHAPLERIRVTNFYGEASTSRPRAHRGIDVAAKVGTPVLAGADGVIIESSATHQGDAKYGKTIVIAHAGNMRSLYAHLDHLGVAVGDVVKGGQVIGRSGATGKVTGPHLHFEVWQGDQPINPETKLPDLSANATAAALRQRTPLQLMY